MRHVYECPMRWADLDQLGHVNNVVYVDYLQEARIDLMRAILPEWRADLTEGVVVVRHEVTYLAPLKFRFRPVRVECWVTSVRAATFTLAYEVFHDEPDGGRRVYVRASTVLTPYVFATEHPRRLTPEERGALEPYVEESDAVRATRIAPLHRDRAVPWAFPVRFSDVDLYRHVNNVKYFEYFQESRIKMMGELGRGRDLPPFSIVVAQTDVDYLAPIVLRPEPYLVFSEVARIGRRSLVFESEIVDGEGGAATLARARVTAVFWDGETQRSTDPPAAVRERLAEVARES